MIADSDHGMILGLGKTRRLPRVPMGKPIEVIFAKGQHVSRGVVSRSQQQRLAKSFTRVGHAASQVP